MTEPQKVLTKADLLSGKNLHRVLVEVPELGGHLYLQELSAKQLLTYNKVVQEKNVSPDNPDAAIEMMALLLTMSICDEDGQPLFEESDTEALLNNSIQMVTRLGGEVLRLSNVNPEISPTEVAANLKNMTEVSSSTSD